MAKTNKKLFAINKPNIKRILETRVLNQAVRRNIDRFPEDFMFPLTREEIMRISQFVISSGHETIKFSKNVMAFTEQGVAMLSSVLNSKRAVQVNIAIMRVFVKLREMIASNKELSRQKYIWRNCYKFRPKKLHRQMDLFWQAEQGIERQ